MPDLVRAFISYSHDSDSHRERIHDLASRLRSHGIDVWIDQFSPLPPEGWPRWMEQQFAQARFVIVACTEPYAERFNRPPGIGSGVGWEAVLIRQELYERGGNTRFVPVHFDSDDGVVPLVLRPYPRYLLPRDYELLRKHLTGEMGRDVPPLGSPPAFEGARPDASRERAAVKLWGVPSRPAQYLPREEVDALKVSLISSRMQTVAIAGEHHRLGIQGMPGVGKTVLAAALAADADIHEAFPGGVFWLTLGRTPDDVAVWQGKLAQALAGHPVEIRTVREGKATLGELFAARPPSLLILDDVWNIADADPFDAPAAPNRLLITTRNQEVAKGLGATVREIRELKPADALTMLAAYAGRPMDTLPKIAQDIVRECGELPLAVAMAGAMLQGRPEGQWPTLLEQLKHADLEYLAGALPQYRQHRSMLAAIEVSVQELPEDVRLRYLDFAVFPEDTEVPERVLQRLWSTAGVKLAAAQQTINMLADRSLVRRVERARTRDGSRPADQQVPPRKDEEVYLTLHDLQHDYVRARGGDLVPRHARLLEAYRSTPPGKAFHAVEPDGYFYENIARHVRDGEGSAALRALLFDHRWLAAKLNATGVNALLADFELLDLASDKPLCLLRAALRLSAHVLSQRPEELPTQLLGRLRSLPEAELQHLCLRIEAQAASPVLLPAWPSLQPPGGALRRTLEGHADFVTAVALSADRKTVISGSADKTLKVWDVETGQVCWTLEGHASEVRSVALSADGKTAVSGSFDGAVKVWNVETGQVCRTLKGHAAIVNAVALSADGKTAASGSFDRTVKVWDVETAKERHTLKGHASEVRSVALSADGKTAVSGSNDGAMRVWDVERGQVRWTLEGHARTVRSVALSADGKTAVSGSNDKKLKVWGVETGQVRGTLEGHAGWVSAVAVSADGKTAVSGSFDETVKVWDVEAGQVRGTLEGHAAIVNAVALSADGKTAVSGSFDMTVKAWDVETGRVRRALEGHAGWVNAVALSADGKMAVSASMDRTLKVWDVETGKETRTLKGHARGVRTVALSADGKTAVSSSNSGKVNVWDVERGQIRRTLEGHAGVVNAVVLGTDGKTAVTGSTDRTVKVWDVRSGQVHRTLEGHASWVTAVALGTDGEMAVSGSSDRTVRVWDLERGQVRRTLEGHSGMVNSVALSADGTMVVSGSTDGTVKVWDMERGQVRRTLEGHIGMVNAVALSMDGKTVVSGSSDRTVKAWDVETGRCVASFTGDADFLAVARGRSMQFLAGDRAGRVHLLALRLGPDQALVPHP